MMKKILLIGTGGTIASEVGGDGLTPELDASRLLKFVPNVASWCDVDWVQLYNLDSTNLRPENWLGIARTIRENYDKYDGFVISHGTDTMSYSASALSFMLDNLQKPVVFTGSQIPLCEIRSDGYNNIVTAVLLAAGGMVKEVCIYFDGKLLRGCRSTKTSSNQFAAFASPNCEVLASVGITIDFKQTRGLPETTGEFSFAEFQEIPVGIIKLFPGIQIKLFESIMTEQLKGVVLESFGAGNIPSSSGGELIPIIDRAYRNGTLVVVCSQCVQGSVSLGAYETSKALRDIGAVNGGDMTVEAAVTKLHYLFAKGYDTKTICSMMETDLRGELTR